MKTLLQKFALFFSVLAVVLAIGMVAFIIFDRSLHFFTYAGIALFLDLGIILILLSKMDKNNEKENLKRPQSKWFLYTGVLFIILSFLCLFLLIIK
ncbi:hypothetical protein EI42_05918 [Thermosporothrix hazakensis]|jgi:uncharacterized membrane protein HdeD (DUF308 family)|uniref:Uncharacterized protein n=1 Tax=Thermosporothrix hazakensis TaxID=644383 RepID=A0A326TY52_THEHA|nr:hypothetical protein [Thermosporothrix hazakensis]PZW20545.1 hypothetical protein EI42_05918 [Thermosporothrix hazakensis]GCE51471.1 hypothetical protein KTH_63400 [Thermosporothrix hazakensis]